MNWQQECHKAESALKQVRLQRDSLLRQIEIAQESLSKTTIENNRLVHQRDELQRIIVLNAELQNDEQAQHLKERDELQIECDGLQRRLHDAEIALDENRKMVTSANRAAGEAKRRLEEEQEQTHTRRLERNAVIAQRNENMRRLEEALGVLRTMEWYDGDWICYCLMCHRKHEDGHSSSCKLAAALAGGEEGE